MVDAKVAKAGMCLAACLLSIGGAAAAAHTTDLRFENNLELGVVDIEIRDCAYDANLIFDDGLVARTTTVVNNGAPCWIRAATGVDMGEHANAQQAKAPQAAAGESAWMLANDGFFYCTHVLENGQTASFSDLVGNPIYDAWDGAGFTFSATVTFEAVQQAAFEPDFSAERPWGDIQPIAYVSTPTGGSDHDTREP